MKRLLSLSLILIVLCLSCIQASAHSGKTDASGGHYDSSTGEYHYHHGYPAHQHTNGKCPYDYKDKTDHSSGISPGGNNKDQSSPIGGVIVVILLLGFVVTAIVVAVAIANGSTSNSNKNSSASKSASQKQPAPSSKPKPEPSSPPRAYSPNIYQLENENARLRRENTRLTDESNRFKRSLGEKEKIISNLRATDEQKRIAALEAQVKSLTKDRNDYRKQVEDLTKQNNDLSQKVKAIQPPPPDAAELTRLRITVKDLHDQNQRLRQRNTEQAEQISSLSQAKPEPKYSDTYVHDLQSKISTLESINETHKKTITSLKKDLTESRKASPLAEEERRHYEEEIETLKEELKEPAYFKNFFTSMLRRMEKEGDSLFYNYPSVHLFLRQVTDKRFHRAMIEDMSISGKINVQASIRSSSNTYTTSLQSCGCEDFRRNNAPCKHMMFLAYHTGVLLIHKDDTEKGMKKYISELQATKPKK